MNRNDGLRAQKEETTVREHEYKDVIQALDNAQDQYFQQTQFVAKTDNP